MLSISLTIIAIFVYHIWQVVEPVAPPAPKSEYDGWRGKAYLDDYDMVEIANWVGQLTAARLEEALKYYWVNNEVMYSYGAVIRGMFAAFNVTTADKKIESHFLVGAEVIIHYILLKSFPVVGRRGGIRGNGHDSTILRAGVAPLIDCFTKANTTNNFTVMVFPIAKAAARRKRHVLLKPFIRKKTTTKPKRDVTIQVNQVTENILVDNVQASTPSQEPPPVYDDDDEQNGTEINAIDRKSLGRYTYALSHGSQKNAKKTNIVLTDESVGKMENVAVSVFWLIYQLIPVLCKWTLAEKTPYKTVFDKIVGLVLSMYLYDLGDFAEEYERIFNMTTPQFEAEWIKIESLARNFQGQKKLTLTKPYSDL